MTAHEGQMQVIYENVQNLIGRVTKLDRTDENFKRCDKFIWHHIRNHKHLSVNSHEIKRKMDFTLEKFTVNSFQKYADYLNKLYTDFINHPLCLTHYEVDVQWAVMEFLLTLSKNPIAALKKTKLEIPFGFIDFESSSHTCHREQCVSLLKEEFIALNSYSSDSDLSEWTDSDTEETPAIPHYVPIISKNVRKTTFNPPKKLEMFTKFDGNKSIRYLCKSVQNSWWPNNNFVCGNVSSNDTKFCLFSTEETNNLAEVGLMETASEYYLLRELIWMFQSPTNNQFYTVIQGEINIRKNVSIPSVSAEGLQFCLEVLLPYVKMINFFRNFINSVYYYIGNPPPSTYEHYTPALESLLKTFYNDLIRQEEKIAKQHPTEVNTLIQFISNMSESFQYLKRLYVIHSFAVLDFKKVPAHICSAHLIAGLMQKSKTFHSTTASELAVALFLSTIKAFCSIIDNWWTGGRLNDLRNEFLFERVSNESEDVSVRQYTKSQEKTFVTTETYTVIQKDLFLKLLLDLSMEASCTLNLLYQINKTSDMKSSINFKRNLYDLFLEEILLEVAAFKDNKMKNFPNSCSNSSQMQTHTGLSTLPCSVGDDFILMIFSCSLNEIENETPNINEEVSHELSCREIYKKFSEKPEFIIPFEEIILRRMTNILQIRIASAKEFVIRMYKEEFQVLKHLQNIRKVLLLESSDLMYSFYVKLFVQIESGKHWAAPLFLTLQLDDIICSKFPEMSSLFRIEINSTALQETNKVTEAIECLTIGYNVKTELGVVITDEYLMEYNKVFRFLLRIKWGLWALENLHFSAWFRKRVPNGRYKKSEYVMRRMAQLRFWILHSMQCIHFYLMTYVLHSMGEQLDKKMNNCRNITEMQSLHESYIKTVCEHCIVQESTIDIQIGILQLLNLIFVFRLEWNSCSHQIEINSDDGNVNFLHDVIQNIEALEKAYIQCYKYLAKILNDEVYLKQNVYLTGLSEAFDTSIPY